MTPPKRVQHQVQVRRAHPHFIGRDRLALGENDIRQHRATFLRQPRLVQVEQGFAFHERRIAQQGVHGDHTGATHTRNIDGIAAINRHLLRRLRDDCSVQHRWRF